MKVYNKLLLGAHVSISGGIEKCISRGESIDCTTIQIFTKSNRQWYSKKITDEEAKIFKETLQNSSIRSVVVHASYLINIGSSNKETEKKSINALKDELERCNQLGLEYLILHPGNSSKDLLEKDCLDKIANNINNIFNETPESISILLENMAGMGNSVAHKFEQIAYIYNKIKNKSRIGVCFDTCHAFAAEYDFRTLNGYENMWKEFNNIIGLELLKSIHLNDSKKNYNSKVDRHEFISKGHIGLDAFRFFINDSRFFNIPKILETPVDNLEEYKNDIKYLVNLIDTKNQFLIKDSPFEKYID